MMQLEFAFLADSAQVSSDSKMFVLGGGIDRISSKQFPATHPYMSLVVKIQLHPAECEREHGLEVDLWDPDGKSIGAKVTGKFSAQRQAEGRSSYVQLVMNMIGVEFRVPGDYGFQILADGQLLKTLPLRLELLANE
jgi:hypothetical protein